ncbi:MAG: PIN domain-containing protein [Aestuariivirga sp.]|uniref:type II toxin-antitoxin system VapC family toxin n=1 Tax=Aestuariivirga sp. TaxID=2650926 RepID=UPI0025B99E03|nr:PIN domain-containing protein [Aestuariivirga sp.]MCA3559686.1 PIN domain-containing protein [Aestuariivirga sp.]
MADKPRYYWDACAWISLIQKETGRFENLAYVIDEAKAGSAEIWTSYFTLAEVYKRPCGHPTASGLAPDEDTVFEAYILQDFVQRVQVDFDVGVLARRLLRTYPTIVKPQDGIHLATALLNNIDELHTYDRENLLGLSGQIKRQDGGKLLINAPPKRPQPKKAPAPLLEGLEKELDEEGDQAASGKSAG